ncbi:MULTISPECIES: 2-succinyl-6-hydroxy-2,4-cyclohexadiene-1-carboxylate synthase [unclassified Listeria]|uniref:2-succinyl-6-hydroxy-2, 4-cyclohexadiene-1-carboxylate synthase n=1 Tax=unclassified Listeria TaxID=2642072 RepID=UPI000B58DC05|nr:MULTISPECIES: 2-succinyl-6-hydroxy-2,4-cyclohexadiene-1-carboxylate synthase [unclassified Listeria]
MKLFLSFINRHAKLDMMLLHGFTGTHKTFGQLELGGANLILPDLPGHGASYSAVPDDYSLEATEAALNALVRADKPTVLVGYSMGARIALALTMRNKAKYGGLVMISGSPGLKTDEERATRRHRDADLAQFITEKGVPEFVAYWENLPLFASQKSLAADKQEQIRDERLSQAGTGLIYSLAGVGTGELPSYWADLVELDIPVLLIAGELDEKFCRIAKEVQSLLPNATYVSVKDAGHAVHLEAPEEVSKMINNWLNDHF